MRIATVPALLLALGLGLPGDALAQRVQTRTDCRPAATSARQAPGPSARAQAYDVVVDVRNLCVERIRLNVQNLDARLALNARVANLVQVRAGADVRIAEVDLGIRGVEAQALLLVDLDNVVYIVNRALSFIDQNPEIVEQLVGTVQNTVQTVGDMANTALQPGGVVGQTLQNVTQPGGVLSQTVNSLGQTVQRTVDGAGNAVGQRNVGNLLNLPVLRQTTNSAGQTVRQVRDQGGSVIEYTLDQAGKIVSSRVVRQGRSQRR